MAGRVVLHVGAMKTGTSFVQSVLGANQELLADRDVRFLGGRFGVQSRAVHDLLNLPQQPARNKRKWRKLVAPVPDMESGTAVVSMEFLSFAHERHVRAALRPFREAGARVEVVLTVRDQFRVIPAQWQTYTRNFGEDSWEDYLRHIEASRGTRGQRTRAYRTFHRAQDVETVLGRWSTAPGVAKTHIVTVPPATAPREELWLRFCAAAGIDGSGADLSDVHDNVSLGYGSCDLLRRLNPHLADVPPRLYRKGMRAVSREALAPLREAEGRPQLDRKGAEYAKLLNQQLRESMSDSRFDLYGDLLDLPVPDDVSDHPRKPVAAPEDDVRRAAGSVLDHLETLPEVTIGARPSRLDDLVAATATALRQAHGWGE